MNTPNDGGPAFPVTPTDRSGQIAETFPGMTLRDWFAGQALTGMIETHVFHFLEDDSTSGHQAKATCLNHARAAYCIADAMIEARLIT